MTSNPPIDLEARVRARLACLCKPPGSLGLLEDIALRYALITGEEMPSAARKGMYVFCGDHGVVDEGVSKYPQSVTREMVLNFVRGGAAINVLCRQLKIEPVIVNSGVMGEPIEGVLDRRTGAGTRNFAEGPAMSRDEAEHALKTGCDLAEDAADRYDIAGVGEMGIGNTTSATAILCAYSGHTAYEAAGPGAGLDSAGVRHKAEVIERALLRHRPDSGDGVGVLAALGGFEIGAIAGFLLGASKRRLPVVIDGFPSSSAALIARSIQPDVLANVFFSHVSDEPAHQLMLDLLEGQSYIDLAMRLGEGTGAALVMNIIDSALRLYCEMATFAEAGISGPEGK